MRSTAAAVIVGTGDVGQPLAFQGFTGRPLAANGGRIDPFALFRWQWILAGCLGFGQQLMQERRR